MTNQTIKKGFTLIEIVIVLAIAALIMVVVFLAVQGAQRNQRDEVRKSYINRVQGQLEQFAGNNNSNYPANATEQAAFIASYMDGATANGITFAYDWTGLETAATCSPSTAGTVGVDTGSRPAEVNGCLEAGSLYNP